MNKCLNGFKQKRLSTLFILETIFTQIMLYNEMSVKTFNKFDNERNQELGENL